MASTAIKIREYAYDNFEKIKGNVGHPSCFFKALLKKK